MANVILPLPTGGSVRLSEVADVSLESLNPDTVAKTDGTACVILQVSKQSGANEASTAQAVAEAMAELKEKNAAVAYSIPYLASDYIDLSVDAAIQNIILGVVLAAIVVFLFLRRLGATATIAVSMPVCILTVFVLMNVFDLTLNMMSLGGIAMGVGMIVDNSIVVLENIYRYAAEGHSRMESCVDGTKEVFTSLTASTLTTVAVFLPLGLTGGIAGMLFNDFCLTIAFLILASLVIAVTLVPLLCYFLLDENRVSAARRAEEGPAGGTGKTGWVPLMDWYTGVLAFFVRHLWAGMLASVALVVLFSVSCLSTKMVLMPEMDQGMVSISVSTPIGLGAGARPPPLPTGWWRSSRRTVPELESIYYITQAESVLRQPGPGGQGRPDPQQPAGGQRPARRSGGHCGL